MAFPRDYWNDRKILAGRGRHSKRKALPPLRTFQEMAEEVGITPASLKSLMAHSVVETPKPRIVSHSCLSVSKRYYDPKQMREWWALNNKKKQSDHGKD